MHNGLTMITPTETALKRIDILLSNQYRNNLSLWEINFLTSCAKQVRTSYKFDTLTMKQKQAIFNIAKRFKIEF